MAPTSVPIDAEVATTVRPTRNEMRAPARTRDRMSRPSSSRPNGCADVGPARRSASSCVAGSTCTRNGPTMAAATPTSTMTAPMRSMRSDLLVPDARIEQTVGDIREEIHRDVGDGDQQNAALDQRVIAERDRLNEEPADARPREDRFGNDRAGEH